MEFFIEMFHLSRRQLRSNLVSGHLHYIKYL